MAKGNQRERGAGRSGKSAFLEGAVTGGSVNKNLGSRVRGDSLKDINAKLIAEEERKRKEAEKRAQTIETSETTAGLVDQEALERELQEALATVAPADKKEGAEVEKPRVRVKARRESEAAENLGEQTAQEEILIEPTIPQTASEEYDGKIKVALGKRPIPTNVEKPSLGDYNRAHEGTMRALIPKIGSTAGFHAMLDNSEREARRVRAIESALKKAASENKDAVEFDLNGKKETLTIEHADQYVREATAKLEATQGDLQNRANILLTDKDVLKKGSELRSKTADRVGNILFKKSEEEQDPEKKATIERDASILGEALTHIHQTAQLVESMPTDLPKTEFLGKGNRARLANTNEVIKNLLKKYDIKPATEDDIKPPKAPHAPKVESPKPEVVAPAVAPEAAVTKPPAKQIVVPEGQPYQRISEPTTEADGKQYVRVKYPDGSQGAIPLSEYLPHEGDVPFITAPVAPVSVIAPEEVPEPKVVRAPRKKKVVMTAGDLGLPEEAASKLTGKETPVGVGLEGKGIVKRERNKKIEIDQDPTLMGVGLEGDGVIEKTPIGVGLEGDGVTSPERVIGPLMANPENALALSPEQLARIEAHRTAIAEQAARINTEAEQKGFGATLNRVAAWYNRQPWYYKMGAGAAFAGVGLVSVMTGGAGAGALATAAFIGGRTLSTFGTWAMLNGATSKMRSRESAWFIQGAGTVAAFFLVPAVAQWLNTHTNIGTWIAERLGITPPPTAPTNASPAPTSVPTTEPVPVITPEPAPSAPSVTIQKGDTIWGVVEKGLNQKPEFAGLDRAGKDLAIDTYMKKMGGLTPDQLKALGISSGDINKIQIGEHIKLPVLQDQALFDKAVADAQGLTPEQKANILKYRAGVGQGTAAYVPPTPDTAPAVQINVAANYQGTLESIFGNRQSNYKNFISWRNPDYIINQANFTPEGLRQETNTDPATMNKLRDTLVQLKKAGFTGRTVEQLLQAGARGKAGL